MQTMIATVIEPSLILAHCLTKFVIKFATDMIDQDGQGRGVDEREGRRGRGQCQVLMIPNCIGINAHLGRNSFDFIAICT